MLFILHTLVSNEPKKNFEGWLAKLPQDLQIAVTKYKRWEDRHTSLFGKLLLIEGLNLFKLPSSSLADLKYDRYHRPYINPDIDFNISHSAGAVVCAICDAGKIGVDIEKKEARNLGPFQSQFTTDEWENIHSSADQFDTFYELWTRKEAVLKACGKGFSKALASLDVTNNKVFADDQYWFIQSLDLYPGYASSFACNHQSQTIIVKELTF